jgi:hypothetical protein
LGGDDEDEASQHSGASKSSPIGAAPALHTAHTDDLINARGRSVGDGGLSWHRLIECAEAANDGTLPSAPWKKCGGQSDWQRFNGLANYAPRSTPEGSGVAHAARRQRQLGECAIEPSQHDTRCCCIALLRSGNGVVGILARRHCYGGGRSSSTVEGNIAGSGSLSATAFFSQEQHLHHFRVREQRQDCRGQQAAVACCFMLMRFDHTLTQLLPPSLIRSLTHHASGACTHSLTSHRHPCLSRTRTRAGGADPGRVCTNAGISAAIVSKLARQFREFQSCPSATSDILNDLSLDTILDDEYPVGSTAWMVQRNIQRAWYAMCNPKVIAPDVWQFAPGAACANGRGWLCLFLDHTAVGEEDPSASVDPQCTELADKALNIIEKQSGVDGEPNGRLMASLRAGHRRTVMVSC